MSRLDYKSPGIYVEEVDRGSRPIEGVSTGVGGFIGFTQGLRNGAEQFEPVLVANWNQYLHYFAGVDNAGRILDGFTKDAYLPNAVYGYFLNGGGRCWVVSLGVPLDTEESGRSLQPLQLFDRGRRPSLSISIKPEQAAHGSLDIVISDGTPRPQPEGAEGEAPRNTGEYFTLEIRRGRETLERYENLSMNREIDPAIGTYVVTAMQASLHANVKDVASAPRRGAANCRPINGSYAISAPPVPPRPGEISSNFMGTREERTGISGLFEVDEIAMLACPDLMLAYEKRLLTLEQVHGVMEGMMSLCEASEDAPNPPNRMVVLDTPHDKVKPQEVVSWLGEFGRRSMYAALYYPWIKVPNPKGGSPIAIPPCGHMMGVWCRTDETRGVYKAPANEVPRGVIGLAYDINFREQELLNPLGINCIRKFPNRGIRVWGARTLVEPDKTEWRYISVRRLMSYIEKSIELGTQWAVFEPNDIDLWARVRRTTSNFLERLWREGALFGDSPEQAFYVKCDEELNPPETQILGRLYIEVGVCPVRPAEFVVFRISQWNPAEEAAS